MQMPDICESAELRSSISERRGENQGQSCVTIQPPASPMTHCLQKVYVCETIHLCCFWHGSEAGAAAVKLNE